MAAFSTIFADVTKLGTKLQTSEYLENGKHPIVDQGQDTIAGYTNQEEGLFTDVPVIIFGDHTRVVKYIDMPFFLGADGVKVLKAIRPDTDARYLFYAVSAVRIPNTGYNRHFKWLKEADLHLPDLPTQRRIAATLDKVSEGIDLCRKMLGDLDALVKSQFVEMFGDPATNEKGWSICDLESVTAVVTYGLTVRPEYVSEGIDLVSARELHKGYVDYNSAPKIAENDFVKLSEKGKPKKNDILFSKTGSIGHCALVTEEKPFAITQNAARIGLKLGTVNPLWLLCYLKMDYIQDWCKDRAKGNAVKDFQLQDMKMIPLFDCPLEMQNNFAAFIKQTDKTKLVVQRQLSDLETLKKRLMQENLG